MWHEFKSIQYDIITINLTLLFKGMFFALNTSLFVCMSSKGCRQIRKFYKEESGERGCYGIRDLEMKNGDTHNRFESVRQIIVWRP